MIAKKCGFYFLTFILMLCATFILMRSIPGDPFSSEKAMPKEVYEAAYKYYGLDKPLYLQLWNTISSILRGDFGISIYYSGKSVNSIIWESFPYSLILGMEALFLAVAGGLSIGGLSAISRSSIAMGVVCLMVAIPNFCMAIMLQYSLSIKLGLFPIARFSSFWHTVLPALSLSLFPMAYLARLFKASILEVKELPFVKTAYSKGLTPFQVAVRHIMPNALLPAIGYLGIISGNIIVGSFVIEKIFAIPGTGGMLVKSVLERDYPAIMGLTAFFACILFLCTFLAELIAYAWDPRLRRQP